MLIVQTHLDGLESCRRWDIAQQLERSLRMNLRPPYHVFVERPKFESMLLITLEMDLKDGRRRCISFQTDMSELIFRKGNPGFLMPRIELLKRRLKEDEEDSEIPVTRGE